MDVQTYFFRRKNINAAGNPRSWTDHLLWHHAAHTVDLFQYQAGETISDCYAVQGPIHPQLNIAMDMGIVARTPSGAVLTLSLSFNNDGPLGSFFRYICDNGTYKAFYDDLSDGKDNKIDVSKVDVSMDGIELEDREFIAAIKEKREPNASLEAAPALHARARQARKDHRPAAQGARLGFRFAKAMRYRPNRPILFVAFAALVSLLIAAAANVSVPRAVAAERALSEAQIKKIDGWIAEKGSDIAVSAVLTDILGLTRNDETISSRAFSARDAENNEIHQIYLLPQGKGYLVDRFHQDSVEVYWADQDLVLISGLTGIRGQKPASTSFAEAQFNFAHEVAWWAKFADTH